MNQNIRTPERQKMKENRQLEFKEQVTGRFLKTVSAFANYDGGKIVFGIADDGTISPLESPEQAKLDIENMINDSISPQPDYSLSVTDGGRTVTLTVSPGEQKPYFCKGKAYKRNDTATVEADRLELKRLILAGQNLSFEELKAESQDLSFTALGAAMRKRPGIAGLTDDILKSIGLISPKYGFNKAAELLSDSNSYPGITAVRFGDTENTIRKRLTAEHISVISEIHEITDLFETFYVYEEIDGTVRKRVESIPLDAFREALANAVIHRTWDVAVETTVFMYDDRIVITSPGGLPPNLSKEEFLRGGISVPRNRILADILFRIGMIEKLGTGIRKIRSLYKNNEAQPVFDVMQNSISVTLPVTGHADMTDDERSVYSVLSRTNPLSTKEIAGLLPFGRSKVIVLLKKLVEKDIAVTEGSGRGTKYRLR